MTHPENISGRGGAAKLGSVIAPTVRKEDAKSFRRRKQPCASPLVHLPLARASGAGGDFRYYIDSCGCQHFNFEQRLWPYPSVQMAITPVLTTALETLAINLFAHITGERRDKASISFTSKRVVGLARRFCVECLLTAGPAGWVIPRSTIESWLVSQRRLQSPMISTMRAPVRTQGAATRTRKSRASHTKQSNATRRPQPPPHGVLGLK